MQQLFVLSQFYKRYNQTLLELNCFSLIQWNDYMPTNVIQKRSIMKLTETASKTNEDDDEDNNNNNSCPASEVIVPNSDSAIPKSEMALLAKLEEANRLIETDAKALSSILNHSRRSSDTSQISLTTMNSLEKNDDVSSGSSVVATQQDLWEIWGQVVNDWDCFWRKKNGYVRDLVRKGIPCVFRGIVWQLLCDIQDSPERKMYANYIKATSACEKVIRRDIARTYPEHDFFKEKDGLGQESLFNVMKAYSLYDREVGYCQGSAFIVGLLLLHMPEEEAFAVLVHIMQKYRMRDMFKPSMAELGLCMFQLENLVMEQLPELHLHFKAQNFHTSMYASSWFLTLLTTTLSLALACRVMDVFLVEGMEIIFKMALALLILGKDDLMCFDMEGMLKFFQKDLPIRAEQDPELLMNTAYNVKYSARKMKKLQKEYTTLKIKEQEEMMELKRLRTENRQLKQRNELLEAESARLAQRLIQGQVSRAEEVETTFVLESELSQLRNNHLDTVHNLELAYEEIRTLSMRLQEAISSRMSSMEETSMRQDCDDLVKCLQDELVKVRLREAENEESIKDLHDKIDELESEKKMLLETKPDNSVARLQEELMAVKLREAESSLSLKDLRERVQNLNDKWQKHVQEYHQQEYNNAASIDSAPKKLLFWDSRNSEALLQQLDEELMSSKIAEVAAVAELKELRLKVLQLESQVQLTANQLRRQDEEAKKLRDDLEFGSRREQEAVTRYNEQKNQCADFESRLKEEEMNARIRDAEKEQLIAELKQKIGALEMMNHEMAAERELRNHSIEDSDKICELHDKVAELKAEVIRLKMGKNTSSGSLFGNKFKSTLSVDSMLSLDIEELKLSPDDSLPIK